MKNNLIFIMLVLAIPLMACLAISAIFSSQQNPKMMHGSIAIQGDGVLVICSNNSYGFSCTGKTSVIVLHSPDDFTLVFDNTGKIISGQSTFILQVNQEYEMAIPDTAGCSGKLTGSSKSQYTGMIPLPAIGGPPANLAEFHGPLAENGNALAPWQCPDAAGAFSGSAVQPQDDVTLELEGISPSMVQGSGGKCIFSALGSLSSILTNYSPTCTYRIEEVTTLLPTNPTKSP